MRKIFALAYISLFFFSGCASSLHREAGHGGRDLSAPIPADARWVADIKSDGALWVAYYDRDKRIRVRNAVTGKEWDSIHDTKERASSALSLITNEQEELVIFRDKQPVRDFFVHRIRDGVEHGLGENTIPLARLAKVKLPDGGAGLAWYGEPEVEGKLTYRIYYRQINASGEPVSDLVTLFSGIYPVLARTSDGKIYAFNWELRREGNRITVRSKTNASAAFSDEIVIANVGTITKNFFASPVGEGVVVMWESLEESSGHYRLEGAFSHNGVQWEKISFPSIDNHRIMAYDVAADSTGKNVALVVSTLPPDERGGAVERQRIGLFLSSDGGKTWSDVRWMQNYGPTNGLIYANASAPKVKFLNNNTIFVAWQDWRKIRSGVRYSISPDFGKTWLVDDVELMGDGRVNIGLSDDESTIFFDGQSLKFLVEEYTSDTFAEKKIVEHQFFVHDLIAPGKVSDKLSIGSADRLRERAMAYWKAVESRDPQKIYPFFDPFYRALFSVEDYAKMMGPQKYSEMKIEEVKTIGPIGGVSAKGMLEVEPIRIQNRVLKMERGERDVPTRWIYVDGDWFLEFAFESRGIRFARY